MNDLENMMSKKLKSYNSEENQRSSIIFYRIKDRMLTLQEDLKDLRENWKEK